MEGDGNGLTQKTKKKKERVTHPKLTPDLLLSDNGISFVLLYFLEAFKPH
jgi:TIMELESS-interacting protein